MTEGFSIRKATEDDLDAILSIEDRNAQKFQTKPWPLKIFKEELSQKQSRFFVLTDDETDIKIAGYIMARVYDEHAEILNISIDPDFQRKGNGALLVRSIVNDAMRSGAKRLFLEVRKSNDPAIQLYHSLHFEITRVRKNYYNLGPNRFEDAYEMELPLEEE